MKNCDHWHALMGHLPRHTCEALDSSVGRAVDCSCDCQISIGRWFKSGSREFFSIRHYTWVKLVVFGIGLYRFLDSLVVRISACHVEGPGSIPGRGDCFPVCNYSCLRGEKDLAIRGIEPVTFALLARRSNQLS